ncbi:hypothetical protein BDZ91DRAFT_801622 [Kalaharituber pfeilii]|nr:hypothetical protein BDZ91DRAFT_801622 [Kalaharituber pfeilii]
MTETVYDAGICWGAVIASLWKLGAGDDRDPTEGSLLHIRFDVGTELLIYGGGPDDPLLSWLAAPPPTTVPPQRGQSPIVSIDTAPVQSITAKLGFSTITTTCSEEPSTEQTPGNPPTPILGAANTRKRKGKKASATDPYAIKRQLDDKEAKKIATAPAVTQDSPHPSSKLPHQTHSRVPHIRSMGTDEEVISDLPRPSQSNPPPPPTPQGPA